MIKKLGKKIKNTNSDLLTKDLLVTEQHKKNAVYFGVAIAFNRLFKPTDFKSFTEAKIHIREFANNLNELTIVDAGQIEASITSLYNYNADVVSKESAVNNDPKCFNDLMNINMFIGKGIVEDVNSNVELTHKVANRVVTYINDLIG